MLDDKLIDYISAIKSPFEEEDVTQEDLAYDGYMKYFRDCMLESIGTNEAPVQFQLYWDDFLESCSSDQKQQFFNNLINKIIKHYKMSYLSSILEQIDCEEKDIIDLVNFFVYRKWLEFFPKCLSYMDEKMLTNKSMIRIFLNSDYNSFIEKLEECKRCNNLIREYFKYCSKPDGVETLRLILKDDLLSNFIEQFRMKNKIKENSNVQNN